MAYRINRKERPADEVRRVLLEQNGKALRLLEDWRRDPVLHVHRARQCFKRIRASLRLLQPAFAYVVDVENRFYRDQARRLAYARDAAAMVEAVQLLMVQADDRLTHQSLQVLLLSLQHRSQAEMAGSIDGISKGVDTVCRELRGAARRLEKIPLSGLKKSDLRVGTKLTLKRARKDYRMACERSEPELFHDWRKHVKYAYYHTALMGHLMPDHAQRYALGLGELAAELGCSQDLVVLERLLVAQPDSLGIDLHLQRMRRLVRDAQGESRRRARLLGRQLFGGGHPPSAKILSFAAAPTGS